MSEITNIEKIDSAIGEYANYLINNSKDSDEIIKVKIDPTKKSTVSYAGPAGSFTIKVDHTTKEATAKVKFATGDFNSHVTEETCKSRGTSPVFHKHWGHFHGAFANS